MFTVYTELQLLLTISLSFTIPYEYQPFMQPKNKFTLQTRHHLICCLKIFINYFGLKLPWAAHVNICSNSIDSNHLHMWCQGKDELAIISSTNGICNETIFCDWHRFFCGKEIIPASSCFQNETVF